MSKTSNLTAILQSDHLPNGWTQTTIGDLVKVRNGYAFKSSDYTDDGVLLIRQSNLGGEKVFLNKSKYLPKSFLDDYSDFLVTKGDILIGMSGSIGKVCTYDREEPALQNQRTGLLIFKDESQRRWFWHYLPLFEKELVKVGKGVAVQNVSAKQIESFPIPIAPLAQQTRIVAEIEKQFSRLDEAVANLKRVKANLKRYKAAVLKAAVEGKLTEEWRKQHPDVEPADKLLERILEERRANWQGRGKYKEPVGPDVSGLPELPVGWGWASADQLTSMITDGEHITPKRSSDGVLLLSARNVLNGKLALDNVDYVPEDEYARLSKRLTVKAGDVLLSCSGSVGRSCVVPENLRFSLVRSVAVLRTLIISPEFFCFQIQSLTVQSQIEERKTETAQANIFQGKIKVLVFALPSLVEQHQIVAEVERRLSIVAGTEAQVDANLRRANRLRQSILKQAFSGQLVPQDENDEPASVLLKRIRNNVGANNHSPRNPPRKPMRANHDSPLRKPERKTDATNDFASLDAVLIAILGRMQPGQEYSRADLAEPLGLSAGLWNAAIQELKRRGLVRQVGKKRGARYAAIKEKREG